MITLARMASEGLPEEVRKLQRLNSNNECFECTSRVCAAPLPLPRGARAPHRPTRPAARVPQAPQFVCFSHDTFVCINCAHILCVRARAARPTPTSRQSEPRCPRPDRRELGYRVGSISMTAWDENKVAALKLGGNEVRPCTRLRTA